MLIFEVFSLGSLSKGMVSLSFLSSYFVFKIKVW